MKCINCKNKIESILINKFDFKGNDNMQKLGFCKENNEAILLETDRSWTGYDLSDEEMKETIECPICHKYPFRNDEAIEIYEPVNLICFK